jgi:hypothetical protein
MSLARGRRLAATLISALTMVALPSPAQAATAVGLWHMDEGAGTTMIDASGNGNNGTLTNVAFTSPGFDGGGGAYVFNGSSSKVVVPNSASLNPGTLDVTLTAHVRFTVLPPNEDYDLIRKKGQGQMYRMEIWETGRAYCSFKGSTGSKSVRTGPNLADGNWHTIVCRKTPNQVSLTVDGTTWSKAVAVGSISNTKPLLIGHKAESPFDLYNGTLDEVTIQFG